MNFICFNGRFLPSSTPVLIAQNRSFKWGDGIFETIRIQKGIILLASHHFDRFFSSLKLLQISSVNLNDALLSQFILDLCVKNRCLEHARVRLAAFRDDENGISFLIEAISLSTTEGKWKDKGISLDLYPYARKSMDAFSNIKSANYLIYIMAGLYARENILDDAIVLNTAGRLCDSSRANIFLIKDNEIFTPGLDEGCINGVMRRFVLEKAKEAGYHVHQKSLQERDLSEADELFVTNAIIGLRWVASYRKKPYSSRQCLAIFNQIFATIQE